MYQPFYLQEEALEWANDGYKQTVSFNYGFFKWCL